jgi:AraC-like DNA-binding protein
MPWSAVQRFADPQATGVAVQGSAVEVFPTARGCFEVEITKVRFDRLWFQRFHSSLPQLSTVLCNPDRKGVLFLTESKTPRFMYCGVEVLPGDMVISRADMSHLRSDPDVRNGGMSLPPDDLNAALKTITGRELPEKQLKEGIFRPDPALMSRLLKLHKEVGQLARDSTEILELPEVGRALEAQLAHLMVRCLAEGAALPITTGSNRYGAIMSRFEAFLEANPDRPLYLIEICAAVGASERTLRTACEEHLGMGPIRYLTLRRMHLVRRALQHADPSKSTVTRVVTDHGFWELGRFSGTYRTLFGESPSETLRRPAEQPIEPKRPLSLPINEMSERLN